eukprot:TRINITY_DN4618_c0_g1_i1.p1 TRINITY_DN4618_c0_g1~~TRINITY_DN4618_c0_g1_i1.p1  ORF type:complete len:313 (-),score=81.66 TRINITY_DN4618_c0_g1_i1:38-976(-)
MSVSSATPEAWVVRKRTQEDDTEAIAALIAEAFTDLERRSSGQDLRNIAVCRAVVAEHPLHHCLLACGNGSELIAGVNFAVGGDTFPVWGIGPLALRPNLRGHGLGGRLLREAVATARSLGATSVRLCVDAHNIDAFSLYTRSGFVVREPLLVMERPAAASTAATTAGTAAAGVCAFSASTDVLQCAAVTEAAAGFQHCLCESWERMVQLSHDCPLVTAVDDHGAVTGVLCVSISGYAACADEATCRRMFDVAVAAAQGTLPLSMCVPTRYDGLVRWLIQQHHFVVRKVMLLLSLGEWAPWPGVYFPSIDGI